MSLQPGAAAAAAALSLWTPRQAGLGADRRADRHRRAPEHRHHRRQAPLLDLDGELLQRRRGRRQGADLGGDGRRLLPRPGGLAAARGGQGPAADPRPRAGHRRGLRGAGAADLRVRRPPPDQGGVRRRQDAGGGTRCSCSGWRSRCSPAPTWRSSTCWRCIASGSWCAMAVVAIAEPILLLNAPQQADGIRGRRARRAGRRRDRSRSRSRSAAIDRPPRSSVGRPAERRGARADPRAGRPSGLGGPGALRTGRAGWARAAPWA